MAALHIQTVETWQSGYTLQVALATHELHALLIHATILLGTNAGRPSVFVDKKMQKRETEMHLDCKALWLSDLKFGCAVSISLGLSLSWLLCSFAHSNLEVLEENTWPWAGPDVRLSVQFAAQR